MFLLVHRRNRLTSKNDLLKNKFNHVTHRKRQRHGHGQDVSVRLLRVALPTSLAGLAVGLALLAVPVWRHDGHRRGPRDDAKKRKS